MQSMTLALLLACSMAAAQDTVGLAKASAEVLKRDPDLALILARIALERADTVETRSALYDALVTTHDEIVLRGHTGAVVWVDIAPDDAGVVTASEDGTARVWDTAGKTVATLKCEGPVKRARFIDGGRVVTETGKKIRVWTVAGESIAGFPASPYEVLPHGVLLLAGKHATVWTEAGKRPFDLKTGNAGRAPGGLYAIRADGHLRMYDVRGRETLMRHDKPASAVVFAKFAPVFATYGEHSSVTLWSRAGKRLASLHHDGAVERVAVSPYGTRVFVASDNGRHTLWNSNGKRLWRAPKQGKTTYIYCSRHAHTNLAVHGGNRISIWFNDGDLCKSRRFESGIRRLQLNSMDMGSGVAMFAEFADGGVAFLAREFEDSDPHLASGRPTMALWGNGGGWIFAGGQKGDAGLWQWYGGFLHRLPRHKGAVTHACFSRQDDFVVTASRDKTARLWWISSPGTEVLHHNHGVDGVGFVEGADRLVISGYTELYVRNRAGRLIHRIAYKSKVSWWERAGQRIVVACEEDKSAHLYDLDGKEVAELPLSGIGGGVGITRKGDRIITWSPEDRRAKLWDASGKQKAFFPHTTGVRYAGIARNGKTVVTCDTNNTMYLWGARGKKPKKQWRPADDVLYAVFSNKNDRFLVAPAKGNSVQLHDIGGKLLATLGGHRAQIWMAQFSTKGDAIVTTSADKTARLWDGDGKLRKELPHPAEVLTAMFLADDSGLITSAKDGSVRHWDASGRLLAVMRGHSAESWRVAIDDEKNRVVTTSWDQRARIWPLDRGELLKVARRRVARELTQEERRRYKDLLAK